MMTDPYVIGIRESEMRAVLLPDFEEFKDEDLFQTFLINLVIGFGYTVIWEDIRE